VAVGDQGLAQRAQLGRVAVQQPAVGLAAGAGDGRRARQLGHHPATQALLAQPPHLGAGIRGEGDVRAAGGVHRQRQGLQRLGVGLGQALEQGPGHQAGIGLDRRHLQLLAQGPGHLLRRHHAGDGQHLAQRQAGGLLQLQRPVQVVGGQRPPVEQELAQTPALGPQQLVAGEGVGGLQPAQRLAGDLVAGVHLHRPAGGEQADQVAQEQPGQAQRRVPHPVQAPDEAELHDRAPGEEEHVERQQPVQRRPVDRQLVQRPGRDPGHRGQAARADVGHQHVGPQQQGVDQQGLAIPVQVVEHRQRALPADLLPGLHGDAQHPARALAHRRRPAIGEVLPGGDVLLFPLLARAAEHARGAVHRPFHRAQGEVHLLARQAELEPDLVVLGEAVGVERLLAVLGGDLLEGVAGKRAAHAGRRHQAADRLAHQHVLQVGLAELVDVGGPHQLGLGHRQREHRGLHEVVRRDQHAVQAQRQRMDQILRVVHQQDVVAAAGALLVEDDALVDPVQAVGLAGGAVVRHHDLVDVARPAGDQVDLLLGVGVVAVGADEDVEVALVVVQAAQVVIEHLLDDVGLLPGGHHDGDPALGGCAQLGQRDGAAAAAVQAAEEVVGVEEQLLEAVAQDAQTDRVGEKPGGVVQLLEQHV
jgi:hypothetical protein